MSRSRSNPERRSSERALRRSPLSWNSSKDLVCFGIIRVVQRRIRSVPRDQKYAAFRALHERSGAFVVPNPWDAGTESA